MARKDRTKPYSLCIIGNSHVAALKHAWTNRAPAVARDFSVTFFSAQNKHLTHLKREGRALVPDSKSLEEKLSSTSGGSSRIEIDAYDAFFLVGGRFGVDVERFSNDAGTVTGLKSGAVKNLVSRACFAAIAEAKLGDSLLIELAKKVAKLSKAPMLIAPTPYLSESALNEEALAEDPRFRDLEFLTELVTIGRSAAERVAGRVGAEIVWQDESTVSMPGFTKAEFGLGAALFYRTSPKAQVVDRQHGNEDYGFLLLMKALRRLDEISGGRAFANASVQKKAAAI